MKYLRKDYHLINNQSNTNLDPISFFKSIPGKKHRVLIHDTSQIIYTEKTLQEIYLVKLVMQLCPIR